MIGRGAWWSAVALLTASVPVHGQDIAVQLRFDGRPLQTTAPPEFSCHDDNSGVWIGCKIAPRPATGGYVLTRPAPGTYTLHVAIDENQDNPARFPGDYDVFQQFVVASDMPVVLNVDMPKLMHTTFPWDNNTKDICANCKVGDLSADLVRGLADALTSRGEPEAAIQMIQRLLDEREAEISAYSVALTFETMSRAYWSMKDADRAKAAIQEGLRRFPNGWQADQLRRTLERYEKG